MTGDDELWGLVAEVNARILDAEGPSAQIKPVLPRHRLEVIHEIFLGPAKPTPEERANMLRALADFDEIDVWHIDEFPPGLDPLSWEGYAWKIKQGDPPRPETIATKLRIDKGPMPEAVRIYIAGLLDGSVKLRRGPRTATMRHYFEAGFRAQDVRYIQRLAKRLRRRGVADSYRAALEKVAKRTGISEQTLDKWVYPRRH